MVESDKEKHIVNVKMPDGGEIPKTMKIEHHRSPHFSSHFSTNTILTGPTADGFYHLMFFTEAVGIKSETATLKGEATKDEKGIIAEYTTHIGFDDLENFREDKARITLSYDSLLRLRDLLNRQYPPEKEKETDGEVKDEPT